MTEMELLRLLPILISGGTFCFGIGAIVWILLDVRPKKIRKDNNNVS